MRRTILVFGALALLLGGGSGARAGLVLDHSPATTGADVNPKVFANLASVQYFADRAVFSGATQIDGMDIYTTSNLASVGQSVRIRVWSDSAGVPGSVLDDFTESLSAVDTAGAVGSGVVRAHADFTTPIDLAANTTYWIGMTAATNTELGQLALTGPNAPDDGKMAEFLVSNGVTSETLASLGDMAFRLEGVSAVPAPPGVVLAGLGILCLGACARLRRGSRASA